jgi:3-phosphoshikimate 1-carboxyvinyltransferase
VSSAVISPGAIRGAVRAPPSKSYTHRALVAGFFARRPLAVLRPNDSTDTRATRAGLEALGATVVAEPGRWIVDAPERPLRRRRSARIDCVESGTTMRLLTAVAATQSAWVRLDGRAGLARRPVAELLSAIRDGGGTVRGPPHGRSLPYTVRGPLRPGPYAVDTARSSQFVSSLLLVLPSLAAPSRLRTRGPKVSWPYVDATRAVLASVGVAIVPAPGGFRIPAPQTYRSRPFLVPGDASSAGYLWAAAAITGGQVTVRGIDRAWPQADLRILPLLRSMGASVRLGARSISVAGPTTRGCDVDLTGAPDLFPLAGVLAASTPGATSRLRGAPHVVWKESDRRRSTRQLVRVFGGRWRARGGAVEIRAGRPPSKVRLRGARDHRVVMSAAVGAAALRDGGTIADAEAVRKSFPDFWSTLDRLGPEVRRTR